MPPTDANALQLHLLPSEPPARRPALAPGLKTYKSLSIHQKCRNTKPGRIPTRYQITTTTESIGTWDAGISFGASTTSRLGREACSLQLPCQREDIPTMTATIASCFVSHFNTIPRTLVASLQRRGSQDNWITETPRKTRRNARSHGCRVPGNLHAREPQTSETYHPQKQTSYSLFDVVMYSDCALLSQSGARVCWTGGKKRNHGLSQRVVNLWASGSVETMAPTESQDNGQQQPSGKRGTL
jgi:hypothetical protein